MIDTTPVKAISHSVVINLRRRTAATISSSPVTTAQIPITNTNPRATAAGLEERQHANGDSKDSAEHQQPPPVVFTSRQQPEAKQQNAVHKGEGSEKQDENVEGDAWPDKRSDSEDDREEPAEYRQPPVTRN